MIRFFVATTTVILASIFLIIIVRMVGETSAPDRQALTQFLTTDAHLGQKGWCWRAICVGQTLSRDTLAFLNGYKIESATVVPGSGWADWVKDKPNWQVESIDQIDPNSAENRPIWVLEFYPPNQAIRLADLISIYGIPLSISLCGYDDYAGSGPIVMGSVAFRNGVHANIYKYSDPENLRAMPDMVVQDVDLRPSDEKLWEPQHWTGFTLYADDCISD